MRKHPNLLLGAFLAVTLTAGTLTGNHIRLLRESESFYRWILGTATQERMAWDSTSEKFYDGALYEKVAQLAESSMPSDDEIRQSLEKAAAEMDALENTNLDVLENESVSRLGKTTVAQSFDSLVWGLSKSAAFSDVRAEFLERAQAGQLEFAKDIAYVDAQAHGVGLFNLFFGFRRIAANFLWMQVDRFWHAGQVERMIPAMNIVVELDPGFIDAYLISAWHLAYNVTAKMQDTPPSLRTWHPEYDKCLGKKESYYFGAVEFLKKGIRKNPRSYKLYFELGLTLYKMKLNDYANAVKYLSEAVRLPHDRWVPRQLYICQELNGDYESAVAGWEDYITRFPGSTGATETAPRFIARNKALIFERRMQEAFDAATEADTPDAATEKRKQAADYKARALQIWDSVDSPYALGRRLRIQAVEYMEQGRYIEADGLLQVARLESSLLFDELSDMIIDCKRKAGLPLSVTEKKAEMRRLEGERCKGQPEDTEE
jgi:tetratricopeptide (TPR) repeat protein